MFLFGFLVGTFSAGACMYYIQPQIKIAVAKAFGAEPGLIADYQAAIAKLQSAKDAVKSTLSK